ncbi:hypothetical protein [Tardiphaga sp.]|uniref:His-rich protein BRANT n=1 Tax=Tardiphaga sp. TaxID=1926292 RepID=UPI0026241F79|nr:hypothetical protein [Tardiphaga sp.]MDB5616094.1 hypothetical protein [Tardiphaga sp.]
MLKKLSAALIVASMLAAPAMAAGIEKTAPAPITKPVASVDAKVGAKAQAKPALLNANAKMARHHHRHVRHHHRFHKKMGMHKTFKHTAIKSTVTHSRHG